LLEDDVLEEDVEVAELLDDATDAERDFGTAKAGEEAEDEEFEDVDDDEFQLDVGIVVMVSFLGTGFKGVVTACDVLGTEDAAEEE
jgi:hypothetical protein